METLISLARFVLNRILFSSNQFGNLEGVFDKLKERYRKLLILTLAAFSSAALFVIGVVFFLLGVTSNYEQFGVGDSRMIGGLVLAILALGGFVLSTASSQWRDSNVAPPATNRTLQDALALAINEFIKDREFQRQQTPAQARPRAPEHAA